MKSTLLTNRSNIRLGFEVECFIHSKHTELWTRGLKKLNQDNTIDDDGSIEPDWIDDDEEDGCFYRTYEIQTSPLAPASAMTNLKGIFQLIDECKGGTNDTCGLHLNISSANKNQMKKFNPWPFLNCNLWNKLLKDFKRNDNDYCNHPGEMSLMELFENFIDSDYAPYGKNSCINFDHWDGGIYKTSHIEIRGMGGDKYHQKFPMVLHYTKQVMKLFTLCCEIRNIKL